MKHKGISSILAVLLLLMLFGCQKSDKFDPGSIKKDFCGINLSLMFCDCAFKNDGCDSIGMSRDKAREYVEREYEKWVKGNRVIFESRCRKKNGYIEDDKCIYCAENETVENNRCVSQ